MSEICSIFPKPDFYPRLLWTGIEGLPLRKGISAISLKLSRPRLTRQFSFSIQMIQNLNISVENTQNGEEMFELHDEIFFKLEKNHFCTKILHFWPTYCRFFSQLQQNSLFGPLFRKGHQVREHTKGVKPAQKYPKTCAMERTRWLKDE